MRGSPLIQAIIAAFFILLLAWPIYRLTRPTASERVPVALPAESEESYRLEIYFSEAPESYRFEYLGKLLLDRESGKPFSPESDEKIFVDLPTTVSSQGIDMIAQIKWKNQFRRHAFEVKMVTGKGVVAAERTLWARDGRFEGRIPLP